MQARHAASKQLMGLVGDVKKQMAGLQVLACRRVALCR
jgi:hypothetical protein